ncbi:hypothetical protein PF005_g8822 [Phytophthora fragariae]|uniref:Peroxisomal membrane protein PEX16 n=1 Tax=Phytophthora fragariae TaxID=53985 RepID=A0A6A3YDV2_9STRA|nr:hypothetical protein PF007_g10420 [Phytophthora fragariae]KAE9217035.1 hypothetical protein PF005_g8822 [Phytophthora fragariae]
MADESKRTTETDVTTGGDSETTKTVTRTMRTTTRVVSPSLEAPASSASMLSKTSSLLGAYEAWVGSHSGLARNVETTLYVALQLVPKRVMEPEVATQFGYSLVGLLHLYHDYVLWKKDSADKDPVTGSHKLTRLRRRAMMIRGGKYKGVESSPRPSAFARFKKPKQPGARTGKTFGKPAASEPEPMKEKSAEEDTNKIMFEDATIEVAEGSREDLLVAGEVCHILRPVVYALLRRHRPETSWTPVIASLFVELSGLALSAAAVKPAEPKMPASADKAKDEIAARKMALLLYLLRDPVFATVTKPAAGKAADVLDYVPLVGKLFRFGTTAVLDYYHQFHFYTSAS